MSLVAYGASGSSDESEDDCETNTILQQTQTEVKKDIDTGTPQTTKFRTSPLQTFEDSASDSDDDILESRSASSSIFMTLPEPKMNQLSKYKMPKEISNSDLFATLPVPKASGKQNSSTSVKETVKIMVPPLLPLPKKNDDEPPKKKDKPASKESGLFSLLPAPRNVTVKETKRSFVPHVLTKKTFTPPLKALPVLPLPKVQKPNTESLKLISYGDSGDDSDEESDDFFSLQSDNNPSETLPSFISYEDIPSSSSKEEPEVEENIIHDKPLSFVSGFQPSPWSTSQTQPGPSWQSHSDQTDDVHGGSVEEDYLSVVEDDLQLDDEALERLCGRRAKKQKTPVEVINVSGAEIMPDPKEWLIKQLSQEQPKRRSHSHKKNDGPTSQQRRKHQITYLAFQAKENELELKNQWSQNRVSRKQTQSKYGF